MRAFGAGRSYLAPLCKALGEKFMPIWAALSASAYGVLIAYQATLAIEVGRSAIGIVPFLIVKAMILLFALTYWDSSICHALGGHVSLSIVVFAGLLTLQEAALNVRAVLIDTDSRYQNDDAVVLFTVLGGVIFPAVVFAIAAVVALAGWCAT